MEIAKKEFERIVVEKFDALPDIIKQRLENIEIFVEEGKNLYLLGIYHGIPFPKRKNPGYSLVMPDKIILFKSNIERGCKTKEELERRIEKVLYHEIGHYLGLDEKELRELHL